MVLRSARDPDASTAPLPSGTSGELESGHIRLSASVDREPVDRGRGGVERDSVLKVVYQGLSFLCAYYSCRSALDSKSGIATSPFKRSHLVPVPRMLIQLPHSLETNPQRARCTNPSKV